MEITLAGTEIHALREALEDIISRLVKDIEGTRDPVALGALKEKERVFRAVMEKLPVEFETTP